MLSEHLLRVSALMATDMTGITGLIVGNVTELIKPIIYEMGFELIDVEFLTERGRWILRIYLDKFGGITLDDCANVSREIGDLIDIKDIIQREYVLEVSSPGLNRPLKNEKAFLWAIGKKVKVSLNTPVDSRTNFVGYLREFQKGILRIETESGFFSLPFADIKKARLVSEFED